MFETAERAAGMVKLQAFHKFTDTAEAVAAATGTVLLPPPLQRHDIDKRAKVLVDVPAVRMADFVIAAATL